MQFLNYLWHASWTFIFDDLEGCFLNQQWLVVVRLILCGDWDGSLITNSQCIIKIRGFYQREKVFWQAFRLAVWLLISWFNFDPTLVLRAKNWIWLRVVGCRLLRVLLDWVATFCKSLVWLSDLWLIQSYIFDSLRLDFGRNQVADWMFIQVN